MTATTIAVSWVSFNSDPYERAKDGSYVERDGVKAPGPTLEFLLNPSSPVANRVKKLYLLARKPLESQSGGRRVHPREMDVVQELIAALAAHAAGLEVELLWWDTDATPIDHREIFLFTANSLAAVRRANPRAHLAVNLSPGTPAMQTVMLLALQARLAGDQVRAFQGIPRDKRRSADDVFREVTCNLLAELAATQTDSEVETERSAMWTLERSRSPRMREVATLVERFGSAPFPVLIIGARGTGKTAIARRLRTAFREWTLKPTTGWDFHLNCAEFRGDASMLRSELFGHVKGSSNLATRDKVGLLERAADDCVFLDEVHWMDPQAQGLLLLALQRSGGFRRIGGDAAIPARFRLLVASNQSRTVLRERLTPDFLDRIADLVIELPELRECHEDLADIWRSGVRQACEELKLRDPNRALPGVNVMVAEFQPHQVRIARALSNMRLPGNFRDLERLARRLLVAGLAHGRHLSLKDDLVRLELDLLRREEQVEAERGSGGGASVTDELPTVARCEDFMREARDAGTAISVVAAVNEWERRLLIAAHAIAGSGTKAAGLVGLSPRTFNAKMETWTRSGGRADEVPRRHKKA